VIATHLSQLLQAHAADLLGRDEVQQLFDHIGKDTPKLIEDLVVYSSGIVSYTIRPSSPLCPIAVYLEVQVRMTVAGVPGVSGQRITVTNYIASEKLTELINQEELFDLEEG